MRSGVFVASVKISDGGARYRVLGPDVLVEGAADSLADGRVRAARVIARLHRKLAADVLRAARSPHAA